MHTYTYTYFMAHKQEALVCVCKKSDMKNLSNILKGFYAYIYIHIYFMAHKQEALVGVCKKSDLKDLSNILKGVHAATYTSSPHLMHYLRKLLNAQIWTMNVRIVRM
jgi:hypothetical protein